MKPYIALTMGDPAGIGPEIILKAAAHPSFSKQALPVVIGSQAILTKAQSRLKNHPARKIIIKSVSADSLQLKTYPKNALLVVDLASSVPRTHHVGRLSAWGGRLSGECIRYAIQKTQEGLFGAIVTCPINKQAFRLGGWGRQYPGHTEMLAALTKTRKFALALCCGDFRAIHVTSHIPLKHVSARITRSRVRDTIRLAEAGLKRMGIRKPRIAVCGLNPHAGEGGILGTEERSAIAPAIQQCRREKIDVEGPLPADTIWPHVLQRRYDIGVAMYHDQGQIPLKLVGFQNKSRSMEVHGVNVTFGLPLIRTSVAHGTAYDIAGKGSASETSLLEALSLAIKMIQIKKHGRI